MDESVIKEFEQQQVGKLKLSAAIRIGAKLRPQCEAQMFKNGASCALGAAWEALFGYPKDANNHFSYTPVFHRVGITSDDEIHRLYSLISISNDGGMTREQVAARLEAEGL